MEENHNSALFPDIGKSLVDVNFVIGIDTGDKGSYAYSLSRITNGKLEIILLKVRRDEKEFYEEVNNLSKYFNAEIITGYGK